MVKTRKIPLLTKKRVQNFLRNICATSNFNECWEWQGEKDRYGYGKIRFENSPVSAHRVSYLLFNKIDPVNSFVLHKCDNPCCCNPFHLFLGDQSTNMIDRENKGRANHPFGVTHGSKTKPESVFRGKRKVGYNKGEKSALAKLTDADIIQIRLLCNSSNVTFKDVSVIYKITAAQVQNIYQGKSWKHIPLTYVPKDRLNGEGNKKAKLTEKKVIKIRKLYSTGNYSYSKLVKMYSVSTGAIQGIIQGTTWKHLLQKTA